MRLLVTRPEPDAERTAADLTVAGHEVLTAPLLSVSFLPPPERPAKPAAIILTSQNGVRALARWPGIDGWRQVPVFVAGPATARATTALGFSDVRTGEGDAAHLADTLKADFPREAGTVLYPAARDRMRSLERALTEAGYQLDVVEAYRAEAAVSLPATVQTALAEGALDAVLLYSRRSASIFRGLAGAAGLSETLASPAYFVISTQVVDALGGIGATIYVAERPDEDSLMALIPRPR